MLGWRFKGSFLLIGVKLYEEIVYDRQLKANFMKKSHVGDLKKICVPLNFSRQDDSYTYPHEQILRDDFLTKSGKLIMSPSP